MTAARYISSTILTILTTSAYSLSVNAGSPCFDLCNGNSPTTPSDIVCTDDDFTNTSQGQLLESCLSCLQTSSYRAGFRSDAVLFLYYLSLTQQTCLVESAPNPIAACTPECTPLETTFADQNDQQPFQSPAGYCSSNTYNNNANVCGACLQSQQGTVILGNFVLGSAEACTQWPGLGRGGPITFTGGVFSTATASTAGSSNTGTVTNTVSTASSRSASPSSATSSDATTSASTNRNTNINSRSSVTSTTSPTSIVTLSSPATASASSTNTVPPPPSPATNANSSRRCLSTPALAAIITLSTVIGLLLLALLLLILIRKRRHHLQQSSFKALKYPPIPNSLHPHFDMPSPLPHISTAAPLTSHPVASGAIPALVRTSFRSRSLRSLRSLKSSLRDFSPATAEWWYAANPKSPEDLVALPQKRW